VASTDASGSGEDEAGAVASTEASGRDEDEAGAVASTEASGSGADEVGGRDVADADGAGSRSSHSSSCLSGSLLGLEPGCGWVWEQGASEAPEAPEASEDDGIFVENN
jgi:hypothetical protein